MTQHSHDVHVYSDAGKVVIDPPRPSLDATTRDELDDYDGLVERYEHRIRAVVSRYLDDQRDIEEAVQDTFVQAWRNRSGFRSEAAVFTWLYRIATNTALMQLRRKRHTTVAIDDLSNRHHTTLSDDPMADHPGRLDRINAVRRALAELPEHHRIAVVLRDVEGYSNREVAQLLGLPVTTVKAHLHRGRRQLRRRLHP